MQSTRGRNVCFNDALLGICVAALVLSGCTTWKTYAPSEEVARVAINEMGMRGLIRFTLFSGQIVTMKKVWEVKFPWVSGLGADGFIWKVDLNTVRSIDVRTYSHWKTAAVVVPIVLTVAGAGVGIFIAISKTSNWE
jgi:hypothetical protein